MRRAYNNRGQDGYVLSSGRFIYANRGILGLCMWDVGVLYQGYDGSVREGAISFERYEESETPLMPAERQEIADVMIQTWKAWAATVPTVEDPQ